MVHIRHPPCEKKNKNGMENAERVVMGSYYSVDWNTVLDYWTDMFFTCFELIFTLRKYLAYP